MADQNAEIRGQLTQAWKDGHFIYNPATPLPQVNGLFIPVLSQIWMSTDDFYKASFKFALHHHALMRLADAAGIQWAADPGRVGRIDDKTNPDYCNFRCVGQYRTNSGLWQELSAHKHINLAAKRGAMETKYATKFDFQERDARAGKMEYGKKVKPPWPSNKNEFIKHYTDRDINQIREGIEERCESGAQVRVIRNILHIPVAFDGKDKNNHAGLFTNKGQQKCYYIIRYILDPANPLVQQAQLASFSIASASIYGHAPSLEAGPPLPALPPMRVVEDTKDAPESSETTAPQTAESQILDFENVDVTQQVGTILDLVQKKEYPHYKQDIKGQPPLENWSQEARTDYFRHIVAYNATQFQKGA